MDPNTFQEDLLGRIKTVDMYQPLLAKLCDLVINCMKRDAFYYAICGERTFAEQDRLYAIGRTTGTPGHYVTKARAGYSLHNYGLACDFARDLDPQRIGLQPDWNDAHYVILAEEAKKLDLDSGYWWKSFKDIPHVNLNIKKYGIKVQDLVEIYKKDGKVGVFAFLDKFKW